MQLATRRLDEMTSREVEAYLKSGGDLIFVPFGPISGHGAFIPLGIHAHWAHALSVLMAEKANGLVHPMVTSVYSGATNTFRGAVSFPIGEQVAVLQRVATTLKQQGFKRVVLVAGTFPEIMGGTYAVRELFDQTGHAFFCLEAARLIELPEAKAMYKDYKGNFGETVIGLASLKILGRERPIPCPTWAKELKHDDDGDQPNEIRGDVSTLRKFGVVGIRYYEENNHGNHGTAGIDFNGKSDIDLAVEVLKKSAELALPALESLARYERWLETHPFKYIEAKLRLNES